MRLYPYLILMLFCLTLIPNSFAQNEYKLKSNWIVHTIAPNVKWDNNEPIERYKIGVYGIESQIYKELLILSKTDKIRNKFFDVVNFKSQKAITPTHILIIDPELNDEIKAIFGKLNYNTLLITDQCKEKEHIMLNLIPSNSSGKKFEINTQNAADMGISFSNIILMNGGNEIDLKDLYIQTERKLLKEKKNLEMQRIELLKQTKELTKVKDEFQKQRTENERQNQLIKQQKIDIAAQQNEIEEQKLNLEKVRENLSLQTEKLVFNNWILLNQEEKIKLKQDTLAIQIEKTKMLDAQITKKESIIRNKDSVLTEKNTEIGFLKIGIIIFLGLTILIIVLAFVIWRSSQIKKKINQELRLRNIAINRQKEEIMNQHLQSDLLNKELEKLSIVAAQTDNAVSIMDKHGNFEWVNVGYTRLYGYTLQLLINERDENIKKAHWFPEIEKIFEDCVDNKKTVVFESHNKKRSGKEVWIQTSLTPILDSEGNLVKLITIETNINKIKKAEKEIRHQHKQILEQTYLLEATNKELEKLSLVASETDNAISIMSAAGNFQWINDGFSRLYGYTYNQLITEYSRNIISNEMTPLIIELIKKCIEEIIPVTYQMLQKTRSGNEIWAQTTLTPIIDKSGNIKNLISISSDISKLKRAEQAIMAQKEELIVQKDRIELANYQINASINYAKTIQNAILPPDINLNKNFKTFVIYKPKDIVSGDFYWTAILPESNGIKERIFYAAVDCTGHGVPGAFMSLIGSRLLNEIVNEKRIDKPSKILEMMNRGINDILRQEQTSNNDGMDVCLCALEHSHNGTTKMTFAGAKRPLYYYKKNEQSLKCIKGTRKTIGGTQAKRNTEVFIDHEVLLDKGDLLYLSTDGIVDQPAPDRNRFGSVRFIELLNEIGNKPIEIQKEVIEKTMHKFQYHEKQRDDVTFLGVLV